MNDSEKLLTTTAHGRQLEPGELVAGQGGGRRVVGTREVADDGVHVILSQALRMGREVSEEREGCVCVAQTRLREGGFVPIACFLFQGPVRQTLTWLSARAL